MHSGPYKLVQQSVPLYIQTLHLDFKYEYILYNRVKIRINGDIEVCAISKLQCDSMILHIS